jgi:hypothetical protein
MDLCTLAGRVLSGEAGAIEGTVLRRIKLTSIEINGTYYGSQKPESFRKWASEVPDGFIFSVKGHVSPPTGGFWPRPETRSNASMTRA